MFLTMQYFVLTLLLVFFGVSFISGIELCDETVDSNLTSYVNSTIQNCGCEHNSCIRKCCKPGYYLKKRECLKVINNDTFTFPVHIKNISSKNISNGTFLVGVLECHYYLLNKSDSKAIYFVQENGSLFLPFFKDGLFYENSKYCVDEMDGLSVYLCFPQEEPGVVLGRNVNTIGMIISMPFLLATFLVFALKPDRTVYEGALMFYVLTLCLSYVLLVSVHLSNHLKELWCEIVGYSTLFFFMVSFFWMNVICFDIWYTFSGGRGFVISTRSSERRRFLFCSSYAWGVPVIHVIIVYIIQQVLPLYSNHNPGVGIKKCFIEDGYPNLWYFYGEAAILIIVNVIFFLLTTLNIRQTKKETTPALKQNDSKRHAYEKDKQKFNLYLKLLLAMGVNWSMEVISWLVNWQTSNKYTKIWFVTDFFNAVYGVFIFFIFVFTKKTWKLLQKRYYNFVGKPHLAHTITSMNTRSSHYSTSYSTADISLTDRTNGARPEDMGLRRIPEDS